MPLIYKPRWSLTTKLIVTSALVEAVLLGFLVWNNTTLTQARLTKQKQEEITEFAKFVSSTLAAALLRHDDMEIQEITAQLVKSPKLSYVAIKSPTDNIIAQAGTHNDTYFEGQDFLSYARTVSYTDAYLLVIPLQKNNIALGKLQLEFITRDINSLAKEVKNQGIVNALIILVVTVIVLYLLLSALTKSIKHLNTAMTEYIDHHQVNTPIFHSDDEVGTLGKTFDNLINTIRHGEDALKESKDFVQAILDNSPTVIYAKDMAGRYLLANKQFTRLLDANVEQILGKTDFDLFPHNVAKQFHDSDQNVLATRSMKKYEQLIPNGNDLKIYITTKFCLFDKHDRASAICGISTDISDRIRSEQRLKESEENLRSLANNAIDGILVNKKGKHVFTNQRMADMLNTTVEDILGTDQDFVLHPDEKNNVTQRFQRRLKGQNEPIQYETLFIDRKSGEPVPVELTAFICQWDGEPSGVVFVRDITDRKKTEAELKRYREQLEQMVSERTSELESAIRELESFSYSVSHDLRSPLRSIDGFSQLIMDDYRDRLDEQGIEYLTRVRKSAQRMAQLIDDILLLSRVSRHKLALTTVDLSKIATESVATLKELQNDRIVHVTIEPNMSARGDHRLLSIVMNNLLDNAWKYTGLIEQATIECGCKRENGKAIYFVADNGSGFDMQYAEKLFGPFQRLHGTDEFPGTGIGLATVKRIIDRHGGKVWAESQPGKGATFFFTLEPSSDNVSESKDL
ncbi:MAG: PAS domain S-box protein [Gammaproteobacteria bacterium]|nr:PAS domain S-box protein [Gammaproteobacteria bacterium]